MQRATVCTHPRPRQHIQGTIISNERWYPSMHNASWDMWTPTPLDQRWHRMSIGRLYYRRWPIPFRQGFQCYVIELSGRTAVCETHVRIDRHVFFDAAVCSKWDIVWRLYGSTVDERRVGLPLSYVVLLYWCYYIVWCSIKYRCTWKPNILTNKASLERSTSTAFHNIIFLSFVSLRTTALSIAPSSA